MQPIVQNVSGFDINKLRQEAQTRWLKPIEVLSILHNYERFELTHKPPDKPASGSLFLFNRRVLRYFRNDGHLWRRKKNGRTIAEAHERLKVGNNEALSCYYAHGELNPCFQRRSYWMLDPAYEHIVLVHYREVVEGRYDVPEQVVSFSNDICSIFNQSTSFSNTQLQGIPSQVSELSDPCQNSCCSGSVDEVNSEVIPGEIEVPDKIAMNRLETNGQLLLPEFNQALRKLEEQLSLDDDDNADNIYPKEKLPPCPNQIEEAQDLGLFNIEPRVSSEETLAIILDELQHGPNGHVDEAGVQYGSSTRQMLKNTADDSGWHHESPSPPHCTSKTSNYVANSGALTVGKENGFNGLTNTFLTENNIYSSSAFSGILLDQCDLETPHETDSTSIFGEKQFFVIHEISPEWAFSSESAKVIIIGEFLCNASEQSWAVLFGDTEVPLEIVQEGVLRCLAPRHCAGKVKLCITSGNGEPCSEAREFEFRDKPDSLSSSCILPSLNGNKITEELLLLARFVQTLLCGHCSASNTLEDGTEQQIDPSIKLKRTEDLLGEVTEALQAGEASISIMDRIMQELLKDKLREWILSKNLVNKDQDCIMSKQEKGMIHIISGLGYVWALNPILSFGVSIDFRDEDGWTALHWAAHFGREEMVAALLNAGASAGAVTDPTAQYPLGETPASIAAANGHKGLAGYLSEAELTSHLFSLTKEKSETSEQSPVVESDRSVQGISQRTAHLHGVTEDQLSLKDSLEAARNAAQAAARIQSAFRAYSFRKNQQNSVLKQDEYGMTSEDITKLSAASKSLRAAHALHDPKLHKAALSIQKNYRCWKRRKEFLTLQKHVVKIQANVRAHQARKKYKFLRTVGILEKVVLRWFRKGVGLPRFSAEPETINQEEEHDIVKVFRKQKVDAAVDEAISRVLSMVHSPEARMQYRRMLEKYGQAKAGLSNVDKATSSFKDDCEFGGNDDDMDLLT